MPDNVGVVLVKGWIVLFKISLLPDNQKTLPVKIEVSPVNEKPDIDKDTPHCNAAFGDAAILEDIYF